MLQDIINFLVAVIIIIHTLNLDHLFKRVDELEREGKADD